MGITYTAYMMIGIRLEESNIYETKLVKIGEHDFDQETRFDPKTGIQLWKEEQFLLDGSEYLDRKFGPFDTAYEDPCNISDPKVVIGKLLAEETAFYDTRQKDPVHISDTDIDKLKNNLKAYLEPMGLWDESKFGAWLIMNIC